MSIPGAIVVYVIAWWLVFFVALPVGVRHADETEEGHDPGAPANPNLGKKAIAATIVAALLLAGFWVILEYDLVAIPHFEFIEGARVE